MVCPFRIVLFSFYATTALCSSYSQSIRGDDLLTTAIALTKPFCVSVVSSANLFNRYKSSKPLPFESLYNCHILTPMYCKTVL